jgi:hypothetical protein
VVRRGRATSRDGSVALIIDVDEILALFTDTERRTLARLVLSISAAILPSTGGSMSGECSSAPGRPDAFTRNLARYVNLLLRRPLFFWPLFF